MAYSDEREFEFSRADAQKITGAVTFTGWCGCPSAMSKVDGAVWGRFDLYDELRCWHVPSGIAWWLTGLLPVRLLRLIDRRRRAA
jgi:hypothetical protein